jgi:hypothetical protein
LAKMGKREEGDISVIYVDSSIFLDEKDIS